MTIFRADALSGRTALVIGSSRGLGKEIAITLAAHGAKVAFHGRKAPSALAREYGGTALGGDLALPDGGKELVEQAAVILGHLDILVNCAAGRTDGQDVTPGNDGPVDLYRPVIVDAARNASQAAFEYGARYIVNIGSIAGFAGADASGYGAAKEELHALTRLHARNMAPKTLVNCLAPGPVEIGGGLLLSAKERADYCSEIPLHRLATSEDVSNLVVYLVSGGADYLTGQLFSLTGGWIMH